MWPHGQDALDIGKRSASCAQRDQGVVEEIGHLFRGATPVGIGAGRNELGGLLPQLLETKIPVATGTLLGVHGNADARPAIVASRAANALPVLGPTKQDSDPVWHAGPRGMTRANSASPLQSAASDTTFCVFPLAAPSCQTPRVCEK